MDNIKEQMLSKATKRKKAAAGYASVKRWKEGAPEVPAFSPKIPAPSGVQERGWWTAYPKKGIVAVDCEMIRRKADPKKKPRLATIAIVNYKKEVLYEGKVFHSKGSFIVNKHTLAVNGFRCESLEDGREFSEIMKEVTEILADKLIVVYGGINDFISMDLEISDYDVFDLQTHFRKFYGQRDKSGEKVYQPINLRSVYFHFFGKDIQSGIHSALVDAHATIDLFEKYTVEIKKTDISSRHHKIIDEEFDMIGALPKH